MESAVRRLFLALPFFLSFAACLAGAEGTGQAGPLYSLEANLLAGEPDAIEITLRPGEGMHLNGEGYPPLVLEIAANREGGAAPGRFTAAGVGQGETAVFRLELQSGAEAPKRLAGKLRAVACGEGLCRLVNEAFEVEVKR